MPEQTTPATSIQSALKLDTIIGKFATDALLLGALSALGYCAAFAFERDTRVISATPYSS